MKKEEFSLKEDLELKNSLYEGIFNPKTSKIEFVLKKELNNSKFFTKENGNYLPTEKAYANKIGEIGKSFSFDLVYTPGFVEIKERGYSRVHIEIGFMYDSWNGTLYGSFEEVKNKFQNFTLNEAIKYFEENKK